MKGLKEKAQKTTFLPNREEIKRQSIQTLRSSFEIEGIFFSDKEIEEMVEKVMRQRSFAKAS